MEGIRVSAPPSRKFNDARRARLPADRLSSGQNGVFARQSIGGR